MKTDELLAKVAAPACPVCSETMQLAETHPIRFPGGLTRGVTIFCCRKCRIQSESEHHAGHDSAGQAALSVPARLSA
jgi:hypothetical protein